MSEPKITLQQILEASRARPTTPELELCVVEFMDLSPSEQNAILFREMCHLSASMNWILAQFGVGPAGK